MVQLAFYKAEGTVFDKAIRWATGSIYSHVELVAFWSLRDPNEMLCLSSSPRDGGVRCKGIKHDPDHWDFLNCQWLTPDRDPLALIRAELGAKYDFAGILVPRLFGLGWQSKRRWFCSEIVGYALGLDQPHRLSPGDLYNRCVELNQVWEAAHVAADLKLTGASSGQ